MEVIKTMNAAQMAMSQEEYSKLEHMDLDWSNGDGVHVKCEEDDGGYVDVLVADEVKKRATRSDLEEASKMVKRVVTEKRRDSRVWKMQRKDYVDRKTWLGAFLVHMFPDVQPHPGVMLKSFNPFHHIELTDGRFIRIWNTKMKGETLETRYTIFGALVRHGQQPDGETIATPDWDSIIR